MTKESAKVTTKENAKDNSKENAKEVVKGKEPAKDSVKDSEKEVIKETAKAGEAGKSAKTAGVKKDPAKDGSKENVKEAEPVKEKTAYVKVDPVKEAARIREFERARSYALGQRQIIQGGMPASSASAAKSGKAGPPKVTTEAQLLTIIANQQEELDYLKKLVQDMRFLKSTTAQAGYSYP